MIYSVLKRLLSHTVRTFVGDLAPAYQETKTYSGKRTNPNLYWDERGAE